MPFLRTGIDLVEIERIKRAEVLRSANGFWRESLRRVNWSRLAGSDASLAGRFAVKEAVAKALGTGIGVLGWRQIEVERGPQGNPVLHLYGNALTEAQKQGLATWSISISHTHTCRGCRGGGICARISE